MSDHLHELFSDYLKKIYPKAEQESIPEKEIEKHFDDLVVSGILRTFMIDYKTVHQA